jgi:hypothetical protein
MNKKESDKECYDRIKGEILSIKIPDIPPPDCLSIEQRHELDRLIDKKRWEIMEFEDQIIRTA